MASECLRFRKFFLILLPGTNIMIPLELLQGLGSQKSLSFSAFLEEEVGNSQIGNEQNNKAKSLLNSFSP